MLLYVVSHKRLGDFHLQDADELDGETFIHARGYSGLAYEGLLC